MTKTRVLAALALATGAAALLAADFWQSTPYTDWSEKDLAKMLNDSPWARAVPLDMSAMRGQGGGGGMGGGGGRRGGGGGGGMQQRSILIRWVSALPIKQALIKNKFGDTAASDDAKKYLAQVEPQYVVTLTGIPGMLARNDPDKVRDQVKSATSLNRKDKDPIAADTVELHPQSGQLSIIIRFPRTPITLDDKEVEFSTKLGPLVIKRKFKLSEMEFNGKLEM
jgi:hypothetical protein